MPVAIAVAFPRGRYHATPWGEHVNEGLVEWPPAPWRLLRALSACWLSRCPELDQQAAGEAGRAIAELASRPPLIKLPPALQGHTRHYMPWSKFWEPNRPDKSRVLIFDSFVSLNPGDQVVFYWPQGQLSDSERAALALLLARLTHLGRAESWCNARLCRDDEWQDLPGALCGWVDPASGETTVTDTSATRLVRTLVANADHPEAQRRWDGWSYAAQAPRPEPAWNLLIDTASLRKEGWSDPTGSKWLLYALPDDALSRTPAVSRAAEQAVYQVARYVLDGKVLPSVAETLYLGETARRYLQGIYGRLCDGERSPVLGGRTPNGAPAAHGHRHAFYLPSDEDGDGRLDHFTITCAAGFGDGELRALDRLHALHGPGGTQLGLLLVGLGPLGSNSGVPLLGPARCWHSLTPFVATRHFKARGTRRDQCPRDELPETVLREELARRSLPEPIGIRRLARCECGANRGRSLSWLEFRRQRLGGDGRRGDHPGAGFVLQFSEPVAGPLALGYGCHFGLGLFGPQE